MLKKLTTIFFGSLLLTIFSAKADQWDKKTTVTFSAPVELPGMVLPAGTYVFKLLDSASDRHIVQVFNADETKIYTTILAIPNYRLTPTADTVLRFEERPEGTPEGIRAWFYPGDNFGQEFVYAKKRATELAESTQTPVLAAELTPTEKPEELIKEPVATIAPEKKEVEVPQVTAPSQVETAPPLIAKAEPAPAPPQAPMTKLPGTASVLPLLVLVGVGSLFLAGVLRAFSGRRA